MQICTSLLQHRCLTATVAAAAFLSMGSGALAEEAVFQERPAVQTLELFTSQSCPFSVKGDQTLALFAEKESVLALTWPVTYWNYTGWKDTLAMPDNDKRQSRYNSRLDGGWLATPQMVINGKVAIPGESVQSVEQAMGEGRNPDQTYKVARTPLSVSLQLRNNTVQPKLVLYEKGPIVVDVTGGKNAGKRLSYRNVVRVTRAMEKVSEGFRAPIRADEVGLRCAILIENPSTGTVDGAARCD